MKERTYDVASRNRVYGEARSLPHARRQKGSVDFVENLLWGVVSDKAEDPDKVSPWVDSSLPIAQVPVCGYLRFACRLACSLRHASGCIESADVK